MIEALVRCLQRKSFPRTNDSISSISNGIMMELSRLVTGSFEIISYIWVYNNFCVINLPWNSAVTWWLAFLAVDFGYYWFHRMAHGKWQFFRCYHNYFAIEINLFWMAHQVHHSSEEYTLSTALRQSMMQRFTSWVLSNKFISRVLYSCTLAVFLSTICSTSPTICIYSTQTA